MLTLRVNVLGDLMIEFIHWDYTMTGIQLPRQGY